MRVEPNKDPMKVDSSAKVENLNVDKLDGKDSADFLAADGRAVDAARAGFADVAGTAQNAQVANDADRLDGLDSTQIGITATSSCARQACPTPLREKYRWHIALRGRRL
jgi:hypothetical protein